MYKNIRRNHNRFLNGKKTLSVESIYALSRSLRVQENGSSG
jgi:hypothetical protein